MSDYVDNASLVRTLKHLSENKFICKPNDVLMLIQAYEAAVARAPSAPAPPIADNEALVGTMAKAGTEAARKFNSAIIPWAEMTEYQRETLRRVHAAILSVVRPDIESAARAKALDEAAEIAAQFPSRDFGTWKGLPDKKDISAAILALKDRA